MKARANKKVIDLLEKIRNRETSKKGEIDLGGKTIKVIRRFTKRFISFCDSSTCNAGEGCCHYFEEEGVGLCRYDDSYYDLLKSNGSVIFSQIKCGDEEEILKNFGRLYSVLKEV